MLSLSCCAETQGGCVKNANLKETLYTTEATSVFNEGSDYLFFSLHAN